MELSEYLKNIAKLSDSLEDELKNLFEPKEFSKGDLLFKQGEICQHLFYIEKGLVRVYYYSDSGKEITAWFSAESTLVTAIDSFYYHRPTRDYCEVLEDSVILPINFSELDLILNSEKGARLAFYILYEITRKMTEYISSIKFQSAEERYRALIKENPGIQQRTSLGHIASYLGITQETLSRIRANK
jgi:CRP/FNR family transcriptional regulator, anaerobic regulatory protein